MTPPVLYSFRRCPYAMRARMALMASETEVELREILLKNKPPEMLAASPKGTVPVLVLTDGAVIDESLAVMRWALARRDPLGWLDYDATADAFIADNDGPFKHHLDRYKYASRYDGEDAEEHRAAGLGYLQALNARLEANGHLGAARTSLPDIAVFPFVRQFRIADPAWFDALSLSALKHWLDAHLNDALFQRAMTKYDLWRSGEPGVAFGASGAS